MQFQPFSLHLTMVTNNTDELNHLDNPIFSLINQIKQWKKRADINANNYQVSKIKDVTNMIIEDLESSLKT